METAFWSRVTAANRHGLMAQPWMQVGVQSCTREGLRRQEIVTLAPSVTRWGSESSGYSSPSTCWRNDTRDDESPATHSGEPDEGTAMHGRIAERCSCEAAR